MTASSKTKTALSERKGCFAEGFIPQCTEGVP